jgi:hypothetical protein
MVAVSHGEVQAALRMTVGRRGMSEDEVSSLTDYVLSFFGHEAEVIDNRLEVDDRDVFYMLEEEGLLGTRQEEVHIRRGKLWRIHYWVLRMERIKELARSKQQDGKDHLGAVYEEVPEEVWVRQRSSRA